MSTTPRNPGSEHEDEYPEDVLGSDTDALSQVDSLEGPEEPGLVDPFQDPEFLAAQLPDDEEAEPGTDNDPTRDEAGSGSGFDQDGPNPANPAASDLEADGSGSDAPSEDEDRFDAG
jgi:hypothetical protein